MPTRSIVQGVPIFLVAFLLEESIFNQIRLPGGGFTFFLIFTFMWAALSTPEIGGISGFGAGFLLDLSHSSGAPFGMWTLILCLVSYGVAFLGYGDERIHANAFSIVVLTVGAVAVSQVAYLVFGSFLGMETGTLLQIGRTIVGSGLWNILITPMVFPIVNWLHSLIFESRAHV